MGNKRLNCLHPASLALTMTVIVCLGAAAQMDSTAVNVDSRSASTTVKSNDKQIIIRVPGNSSRSTRQFQQPAATRPVAPLKIALILEPTFTEITWPCDLTQATAITTQPHLINLPPPSC